MQAKSTHTLEQTAILLGWSTHTVRIYADIAGIVPATGPHYRQRTLYSDADIELLRRTRAERDPQYLTAKASDTGNLAARVAALEATIERLQQRWPHLFAETRYSAPQLPAVELPAYDPPRRLTPSTARYRAPSSDGSFPSSVRGRSRWVEEHGGPGSSWVRTWVDVASWRGPEDAIASVRRHQRWHDWSPVGLVSEEDNETPPVHAVTGGARPESVEE